MICLFIGLEQYKMKRMKAQYIYIYIYIYIEREREMDSAVYFIFLLVCHIKSK